MDPHLWTKKKKWLFTVEGFKVEIGTAKNLEIDVDETRCLEVLYLIYDKWQQKARLSKKEISSKFTDAVVGARDVYVMRQSESRQLSAVACP